MCEGGLFVRRARLCGYDDIVPHIRKRQTELILAVRIHVRGVKIIYAAVICASQKLNRALRVDALDGQRAERYIRNHQSRAAKANLFHKTSMQYKSRMRQHPGSL